MRGRPVWNGAEPVNEIVPRVLDTEGHWGVLIPLRVMHPFLGEDSVDTVRSAVAPASTDPALKDEPVSFIRAKNLSPLIDCDSLRRRG